MTTQAPHEAETALLDDVRGARDELVELSRRLVEAPSVNPEGDTRGVAQVVGDFLQDAGLDPQVRSTRDTMPNVLATVQGSHPGPHVVLNAHMDTMPPGDESLWSVPRWELTQREGRLYGLGMGNMKGALAGMLVALRALARQSGSLAGSVTLSAVSDEVVFGPSGAAWLLETEPWLTGDALISGEGPGFGRVAVAEKGVCWLELSATADGGHSSAVVPGRSASARLAAAVLAVDGLTGRVATLPAELSGLAGGAEDRGTVLTANVGTVTAGTFVGQIATAGRAEVDVRLPPGITMEQVEAEVAASTEVAVRRIKGWDANWTSPQDPLARTVVAALAEARGSAPGLAVRLPASDASRWRRLGVPAVCFGPQPTLSAGIDDYAELDEVVACGAAYALSAFRYASALT